MQKTLKKYSSRKERGEKREIPPTPPIREKRPGEKDTAGDGNIIIYPIRPRAGVACAYRAKRKPVRGKMVQWLRQMNACGFQDPVPKIVDWAVELCRGSEDDRRIWMKMANRNINSFIGVLMEFEYDLERNPKNTPRCLSSAFQSRLNRVLPRTEKK